MILPNIEGRASSGFTGTARLLAGSALILALGATLCATPQVRSAEPEFAARTGLAPSLSITDYDISLRPLIESDRLALTVTCVLRNDTSAAVENVDFDLFAREQYYGVKVDIANIGYESDGRFRPLTFSRSASPKPADPAREGSNEFPKITRVSLGTSLNPGADIRLRFEYTIDHVDARKEDLPYRIVAALPSGSREICLISDFSWIPWATWTDYAAVEALDKANFFVKMPRPSWKISVRLPPAYEVLVVDGRLDRTETSGGDTVTTWVNRTGGLPQLLIGKSDRIAVRGDSASVVFLLAKGGYEPPAVESMGRFLIRAYDYYSGLSGAPAGNEIHIAVSSAGMGGHGAFLGTFLDIASFRKKGPDSSPVGAFDETAAHELAHSWWGISIASYGRGTKFLREAFCNFSTWRLAKEVYHQDFFQDNLAYLFFRGTAKNRLFEESGDNANLAYTKGALVLDILRQEIGDEVFFKVLKLFAAKYNNAYVTFTDFVALCNEVTLRDWTPFFAHWCYGEGFPIYSLVRFTSEPDGARWRTSVIVRNSGQGIVPCPLALVQSDRTSEETFFVPEGRERTFTYETAARVDRVVIDPGHTAYQGDDKEGRLKMLGIKETNWAWLNYFMGIVYDERGDRTRALGLLSKAVAGHEELLGLRKASPGMYFSRGILYLRMGRRSLAEQDITAFLDGILGPPGKPRDLASAIRTMTYPVLVSGTDEERQVQFSRLLAAVTGTAIDLDPKLAAWRAWWESHRSVFTLPKSAEALSPKGYGK
jgi:hypothetical protein